MSGFKSKGRDLDDLFASGNSGIVTGLKNNGVDIGSRYMAGSINEAVGFKASNGTDIGFLFGKESPIYFTAGEVNPGPVIRGYEFDGLGSIENGEFQGSQILSIWDEDWIFADGVTSAFYFALKNDWVNKIKQIEIVGLALLNVPGDFTYVEATNEGEGVYTKFGRGGFGISSSLAIGIQTGVRYEVKIHT